MLQPGDMSVDLTLAVNYVPAALCLIRVLIFTTGICLIGPGEELGGYQILALVLYLDRVVLATFTQRTIFDSNAVIAAVFFSNIFAAIRACVTDTRVTFLSVVVRPPSQDALDRLVLTGIQAGTLVVGRHVWIHAGRARPGDQDLREAAPRVPPDSRHRDGRGLGGPLHAPHGPRTRVGQDGSPHPLPVVRAELD